MNPGTVDPKQDTCFSSGAVEEPLGPTVKPTGQENTSYVWRTNENKMSCILCRSGLRMSVLVDNRKGLNTYAMISITDGTVHLSLIVVLVVDGKL